MTIKIGDITLYSVKELSELLKVTSMTLRAYFREGRIQGQKVAGRWYVSEESLGEYFKGYPRHNPETRKKQKKKGKSPKKRARR